MNVHMAMCASPELVEVGPDKNVEIARVDRVPRAASHSKGELLEVAAAPEHDVDLGGVNSQFHFRDKGWRGMTKTNK